MPHKPLKRAHSLNLGALLSRKEKTNISYTLLVHVRSIDSSDAKQQILGKRPKHGVLSYSKLPSDGRRYFFQQPSGKVARFRTFDFYEKSDLPYYFFGKTINCRRDSRKDMITVSVNDAHVYSKSDSQ